MSGALKLDKQVKKKLDDFRTAASVAAEEIIFNVFPNKVCGCKHGFAVEAAFVSHVCCSQLQELIISMSSSDSVFNMSNATSHTDTTIYPPPADFVSSDEPDTKKRKLSDGGVNGTASVAHTAANVTGTARFTNSMHANKHLTLVFAALKKECEELVESIDKVKLWVNLSMPKIEDGDNFGVQIQEEVLNELHRSQEVAYNLRDQARQSYVTRGKLCSKIIKYPHIEDYALALQEHDEKQLYISRQNLHDIRNIYAVLTDILHKNINKIRSPKGNNATGLY
ncbi:hypothetical protein NM688_g7625 [Phlebia brevispora]|uniref:Uncharacterized protein n=1 Tax=Phlebia brevispora TaxID=194682 RepID=A0ACC1S3D0_9APHY|nr:hypothetical protein NM688_g7625 [Phlebia brevispora]